MKEKLKDKLQKFNYSFYQENNKIIVNLGFSQIAKVDFSEKNIFKISDAFNGWNFLTGLIKSNLKVAMIYNSIGITLFFVIFLFQESKSLNLVIFLPLLSLNIIWAIYYISKFESFKKQVIFWIDGN